MAGLQRTMKGSANVPEVETRYFDLAERTPIELIRPHTKTEDIPRVTDALLQVYREAAFEAAEQYTGLYLRGQKMVTETLAVRSGRYRPYLTHRTRYPIADGLVYLYGGSVNDSSVLRVHPGARKVQIQLVPDLEFNSCCNPCARDPSNHIMYLAGFDCIGDVPAGVILGILKFIAFCVANAGDEILTVRNREDMSASGIIGTNNVAWASGALELWRQYNSGSL